MSQMDFIVESLATLTESFIYVCATAKLSGQKYIGIQWRIRMVLGALLYATLVAILNQIQLFSFITILVGILFHTLYAKITANGSFLVNLTSVMITMLVMNAIDFSTFFVSGLLSENPITDSRSFMLLMTPGVIRYLYLLFDKGTQFVVYLCCRKVLPDLRHLSTRYTIILLVISSASFVLMTSLLSMVLSESILLMQTAILFTFLFAVFCVVAALVASFLSLRYQREKEQNRLLSTINTLSEENYRRIGENQKAFDKANHDFRHHLTVIRELELQKDGQEISKYIDSLLKTTYQRASICQCGNSVVDAIINCKVPEAKAEQIDFTYQINIAPDMPILSTDICAILANQIDNSIEACQRDQATKSKYIQVHIWQQTDRILVFQVTNSIAENPFNSKGNLPSSKTDTLQPHGLGIRSIRDTAEKYGGSLNNRFQNGEFISTVYLNFPDEFSEK